MQGYKSPPVIVLVTNEIVFSLSGERTKQDQTIKKYMFKVKVTDIVITSLGRGGRLHWFVMC